MIQRIGIYGSLMRQASAGWKSMRLFRLTALALAGIFVLQSAVSAPVSFAAAYASDSFTRTVSGGWGTAESGGTWSRNGGAIADYQVASGVGSHNVTSAGAARNSWLAVGQLDVDLRYKFKTDKLASGNSLYQFALLRAKDDANYYGARVEFLTTQNVVVVFEKRITGTRTQLGTYTTVSREKHAANVWFWVRAQAQGKSPTTLRIKVWRDGTAEPAAWDYQRTDSSAVLQAPSGAGVRSVTHSSATGMPVRYSYDDFSAGPVVTSAPAPTATPVPLPTATPVPLPTATPLPAPTATPVPAPTATPVPLPTATPVPAPAPLTGTVLHVDSVIGSDANSGATGSPLKTLQKALNVAVPGTTIRLASGVYQEANQTVTAGTATAPIVIEPEPSAKPILDGKGTLNGIRIVKSYYIVRNLEIRNINEGVRLEGVTGVVLEGNTIYNINNEGVRIHYFSTRNTIRNNKIWGCGITSNGEGIYIGTAPEQRYKNGGLPDASGYNLITGNEVYGTKGEAIDVKEDSSFNTIEKNLVHDVNAPNSGGMSIRSDENYLYGNISYNNNAAGYRFGGDTVYSPIYGNNYYYGKKNVLRDNVARNNTGYGYKFMNGPQDANTSNTGSGNGGKLYYYGSGVSPFVTP